MSKKRKRDLSLIQLAFKILLTSILVGQYSFPGLTDIHERKKYPCSDTAEYINIYRDDARQSFSSVFGLSDLEKDKSPSGCRN